MCSSSYCRSGLACCRQWQWYVHGWFHGYGLCSSRCVPYFSRQAQDAQHLGRYEPEGQLFSLTVAALVAVVAVACAWLIFLVALLSRCVPFDGRQALVAWLHAVSGQSCSLPVYATTGFMVQTVQTRVFVFLNKVGDLPVVGPHGPYTAEARGASTGAVLGRRYGHYDRCRGPDSVNCLEMLQFRSCSSTKVVDIPVFTPRLIKMVLIVQKTKRFPVAR